MMVLDVAAGLVTAKGNLAFFARLLQMFLNSPTTDLTALRLALSQGDRVVGNLQAHTLKSLAASIGAHPLRDAALALETALAAPPAEGEDALVETLESRLAAARAAVEEYLARPA
jgi:two-component system sensor histidine kinase/response regulator